MSYHHFMDTNGNPFGSFEVFCVSPLEAIYNSQNADHANEFTIFDAGWYWWSCFPGCLPDGEPFGPFETQDDAMKDALKM